MLYSHIRKKEALEQGVVAATLKRLQLAKVDGSCKPVVPTLRYVDQSYELCALRRL